MTTVISTRLRTEALGLLDKHSSILDIARELSRLMQEGGIPGAVVGGIAVVLHGHVRTTKDVDVFVESSLQDLAALLIAKGFTLDTAKKEFVREGVPVHLVTTSKANASHILAKT